MTTETEEFESRLALIRPAEPAPHQAPSTPAAPAPRTARHIRRRHVPPPPVAVTGNAGPGPGEVNAVPPPAEVLRAANPKAQRFYAPSPPVASVQQSPSAQAQSQLQQQQAAGKPELPPGVGLVTASILCRSSAPSTASAPHSLAFLSPFPSLPSSIRFPSTSLCSQGAFAGGSSLRSGPRFGHPPSLAPQRAPGPPACRLSRRPHASPDGLRRARRAAGAAPAASGHRRTATVFPATGCGSGRRAGRGGGNRVVCASHDARRGYTAAQLGSAPAWLPKWTCESWGGVPMVMTKPRGVRP